MMWVTSLPAAELKVGQWDAAGFLLSQEANSDAIPALAWNQRYIFCDLLQIPFRKSNNRGQAIWSSQYHPQFLLQTACQV